MKTEDVYRNTMNDDWNNEADDFIYTGQENDDILRVTTRVIVHSIIKAIEKSTFHRCTQLTTMILGEGTSRR